MSASTHEAIRRLFLELVDLEPEARATALAERCGDDRPLREAVEALLAADERPAGLLDRAIPERLEGTDDAIPRLERIGSYEVLRALGSGGMGIVYLARQEEPRRRVALKVLRPELRTEGVVRRFERESRVLARLQHPNIAQVHEAGTAETPLGRLPYFAMEYVEGLELGEFVRARRLPLPELLQLFESVCEAVDHANGQGVIHRDLKPSNVLVDRAGRARVLDFGIAHLAEGAESRGPRTRTGQVVGTLAYMSPEQVDPGPTAIDARSDVYGLGAMLYELVSGRPPHDLSDVPLVQAARIVAERDPVPLSALRPEAAGELETIVHRALAKEASRRYASAGALADDLRRLREHRPILARPPSTLYQLRKLARRHRGLFAGLAAAGAALVLGIVATTSTMLRAVAAEDTVRAQLERLAEEHEKVTAVKRLLELVLASPHPAESGRRVRVLDALERALDEEELARLLDEQPEVAGLVHGTVGRIYFALGMYAEAEEYLNSALSALPPSAADLADERLSIEKDLALTLSRRGRYAEAVELYGAILVAEREGGAAPAELLDTTVNLRTAELRRSGASEDLAERWEELVEDCERELGPRAQTTLTARNNLAHTLVLLGHGPEALRMYEELLPLLREHIGPRDPSTLTTANNLGELLLHEGELERAEELLEEAMRLRLEVLGPDHLDTGGSQNALAQLRAAQGRLEEARDLYAASAEVAERAVGAEDTRTAAAKSNLAAILAALGDHTEAEVLLRDVVDLLEETEGPEALPTLSARHALGLSLERQGRFDESLPIYEEIVALAARSLGEDDWRYAAFRLSEGRCLIQLGRPAEAREALEGARDVFLEVYGEEHEGARVATRLLDSLPG